MGNRELAMRNNADKPQLSYILGFPHAIEEVAKIAAFGADKYLRYNWKKGLPYTGVVDSLLRHLTAFINGADLDSESGCLHLGHVAWNALALLEFYYRHPDLDDRDTGGQHGSAI